MSQKGFTLIEMALVLVVVGLMVSGGLFVFAPVADRAKVTTTNTQLDQAENALLLFVIRNQRLPCPADGGLASSSANYGLEQGGGAAGACTVTIANSVIPWKTLGVDESYSLDGWGRRLSYWPSGMALLTNSAGTQTDAATGTNVLVRSASQYAATLSTFITVTDVITGRAITPPVAPAAGANTDQAAYVLVSHGKSGWYGWQKPAGSAAAAQLLPTFNPASNKACNNAPVSCQINGGATASTFAAGGPIGLYPPSVSTYFDDFLRWRSAAYLIQLCGSGSCGNP